MASDETSGNLTNVSRRWVLVGVTLGSTASVIAIAGGSLFSERSVKGGSGSTLGTGSASAATMVPPRLELAVDPTTYPPEYDIIDVADSLRPGDRLYLIIGADARFASFDTLYVDLTGDEASVGAEAEFTDGSGGSLADYTKGSHWAYAYVDRAGNVSPHSNTVVHGEAEVATPSWSFARVEADATRSSLVANGRVTPTGFNVGLTISCSPGSEYRLDRGNGFGAWTRAPGTINPGDDLDFRLTTSAKYLTETTASLTIGSVSGTFSVWTEADPANPYWNPYRKAKPLSLSNGNLTATGEAANGYQGVLGTVSKSPSGSGTFAVTFDGTNELYFGLAYRDIPLATGNKPIGPGGASTAGVMLAVFPSGWEIRRGGVEVDRNYGSASLAGDVYTMEMTKGSVQFKRTRGGTTTNLGGATSPPKGTGNVFPVVSLLNDCATTANFGGW